MTIFDSEEKFDAPAALHAISRAVAKTGILPRTAAEVEKVVGAATELHSSLDAALARQLLSVYTGDLNPMACFIGGMASQEALKLCSGKFTPIHQWMYYDVRELLQLSPMSVEERLANGQGSGNERDRQIAVFGKAFQDFLSQQSAFIVGAGALGCELIKNVALIGLGAVSITDMDTIEISNLSRQFLFRNDHIGKSKSLVAGNAATSINPAMRVTAFDQKMAPETEGTFNETFWNSHSVVLNALDNVASRKYVDERCLFYKKPLFESGTLGTKCNMQPVIPYVTESYSSSHDPPEKSIPLCTLKNFPSAIEHTIQWARDQFHLLFASTPEDVNRYLEDPKAFGESLVRDPASAPIVLKHVNDALSGWPSTEKDCIQKARVLFQEYFHDNFEQLLFNMPVDKRNEDGQLFWSGAKRPPTPQVFNPQCERDADFVYHTANLIAGIYGLPELKLSRKEAAEYAASIEVAPFVARTVTFSTSEKDKTDPSAAQLVGELKLEDLPPATQFAKRRMVPLEFEKDDPTNHHVDFITHCSNTRAEAYAIPPADLVRTKRIAGKIIPAMVTTTSLVTGLVCLEMLKFLLLQHEHHKKHPNTPYIPSEAEVNAQLSVYRSAFVNIALPMIAFSDPILATGRTYALPDGGTVRWSIWDRLDLNEKRDVSVQELADLLLERFHIDVFMITLASGKMLYTSFGGKKEDKTKPVSEVAREKGEAAQEGNDYLNLIATGSIGDDDDIDVPIIRYKFRNF
ncbi:ubiquitin-activating enzyme E1 [Angomonas deanei]|nr:ubiquitin-activating enzyme E1 [Angomonas deanei]|eukprot:EPY35509.1 ubiquitin-activating enzyme E1 [Angomonas deanei]